MQNPQKQIQLGPEEIQRAAKLGVELFNTKGVLTVDGPTALSPDFQVLNLLLANLAEGTIQVGNPTFGPVGGGDVPPPRLEEEGNGDS